jgi:hypothetical protein
MSPTEKPTKAQKPETTKKPEAPKSQAQESITATSTTKKTSGLAVAALVLAFFFPVVGFILGIVALSSIKKNNESGRGLAISAIVVSVVLTLIGMLTLLIFVLAIGKAANETGINGLDTKNGSISVTGKDGETATIGKSVSLPSGFPSDVPIYKPSDVIVATSNDGKYSVSLLTSDSETKVSDYYTKQLASNGWVAPQGGGDIRYEGGMISNLEKDGNVLGLIIAANTKSNDGKTSITITVGPKSSNN